MRLRLSATSALLVALASRADAQLFTALRTDTRVRIETTNGDVLAGRVVYATADTVWLKLDRTHASTLFGMTSIRQYAISRGVPRKHGAGRGALIGGAVGLTLGLAGTRTLMRSLPS